MTRRRQPTGQVRRRQLGAGALIVVMVLFFVMSLVAAYSNRNIIFEQKTSANQYRSTQAAEAAEAGIEWALGMLNSGTIDNNCLPAAGGTSFRDRYLNINPSTGAISGRLWPNPTTGPNSYNVACVLGATGWSCSCPTNGAPALTAPATAAPAPAFQLLFQGVGNGYVQLMVKGCTRYDPSCLTVATGVVSAGDAGAKATVLVALKSALATPPAAALTAVTSAAGTAGNVNIDFAGGGSFQASNAEASTSGVTIDAAGAVYNIGSMTLASAPGSPGAGSVVPADARLIGPWPSTTVADPFVSLFGMARTTYQQQPAAIVLDCTAGQCTSANIANAVNNNPGRIIWLEGDAALGNANLGSAGAAGPPAVPASPVVIVAHGNLTVNAGATVNIFGLLYVYNGTGLWTSAAGGTLSVTGATVVEGNVGGPGALNFTYSNAVNPVAGTSPGLINQLRLTSGSFVRVPGSWLDSY